MFRQTAAATIALSLVACGQKTEPPSETAAPPPAAEPARSAPATAAASSSGGLTAQGYGPLRIGMSRADVEAALGADSDPAAVGGPQPEVCDQFRPARAPSGMLVMIENGRLTRISVSSPSALKTDRGFGVGDAATDIKAEYGAQALSQPHKYWPAPAEDIVVWAAGAPARPGAYVDDANARGVRYEINAEGRVQHVHVGGPSIQLVEGCA